MGVVVDTSVFTLCERQHWTAIRVGLYIDSLFPAEQIAIPSVVAAELVHGIYRAKTPEQQAKRDAYIKTLLTSYTVAPFAENAACLPEGSEENKRRPVTLFRLLTLLSLQQRSIST